MTAYNPTVSGGVYTGGKAWVMKSASGGVVTGGSAQFSSYIHTALPVVDVQKLDAGTIVELFVVDTTILGGSIYYLSPNVNENGAGIVWKDMMGTPGVTYTPFPISISGFERNAKGVLSRPVVTISNVNHLVSDLVRQYGDLCGCTVTRRRVMAKQLPLTNFSSANGGSVLYNACVPDYTTHYPDDSYYIERRSSEVPGSISFELSSYMDVEGVQLPGRIVQRTWCPWVYQGTDPQTACPFLGPFTGGNTTCAKTVADCKVKFPYGVPLPFGGFSGARRT